MHDTNEYDLNQLYNLICMIRMVWYSMYTCMTCRNATNQKCGSYPQGPFYWVGLWWFLVCNSLTRKMKPESIDLSCWLFQWESWHKMDGFYSKVPQKHRVGKDFGEATYSFLKNNHFTSGRKVQQGKIYWPNTLWDMNVLLCQYHVHAMYDMQWILVCSIFTCNIHKHGGSMQI